MLKSAFSAQCLRVIIVMNDETLPNFLKRKHPSKEEKKETKCKDRAKEPQRVSPAEEKEPLSTKTSTGGMKHIN